MTDNKEKDPDVIMTGLGTKFKVIFRAVFLVALVCTVSGCGIKPGQLTPPSNESHETFPAQYPRQ